MLKETNEFNNLIKNPEKLKCVKWKCRFYHESDNYFETCQLISRIVCKIAKLVEELECLNDLEELIKSNQK